MPLSNEHTADSRPPEVRQRQRAPIASSASARGPSRAPSTTPGCASPHEEEAPTSLRPGGGGGDAREPLQASAGTAERPQRMQSASPRPSGLPPQSPSPPPAAPSRGLPAYLQKASMRAKAFETAASARRNLTTPSDTCGTRRYWAPPAMRQSPPATRCGSCESVRRLSTTAARSSAVGSSGLGGSEAGAVGERCPAR